MPGRGKILNLRKKPSNRNPVIEILGCVDVGKTFIANLLARRILGTCITLPKFDPDSATGLALLKYLSEDPQHLERNPEWWAHIYAANIYEQKSKIVSALEAGPVIVTNYWMALRGWVSSTDANLETGLTGFSGGIPPPTIGYVVLGPRIERQFHIFSPKFSPSFMLRVNMYMSRMGDKRCVKIHMQDSPLTHIRINKAVDEICEDLKNKFKINYDKTSNYTVNDFPKKKDLGL